MRRPKLSALVVGLALLLFALAVWLLETSPAVRAQRELRDRVTDPQAEAGAPAATGPAVLDVDALVVRQRDARIVVEIAGVLEPVRAVTIGAEVEGRVVGIEVEEHTLVAAGAALVRLDPALPQAAVARAEAALLRAEAVRALAEADLARQRQLAERGVASTAELDRAEADARAGRAQVAEAQAALLDARTRLDKTRIRAPFAGVVSGLDLEPGAYLRPGDRVAQLADLTEIEVEVGVSDEQILALRDGDPARLSVEALRGRWFEGRITRPARTADATTRRFPVAVRIPNQSGELLPGMLGTVRFELGEAASSLRIPQRAVQREFDLDYVFVLEGDGGDGSEAVARRRRIRAEPVAFLPQLLEVNEGLDDGDAIAVSGLRELRDGLRVRVRERSEAALAGVSP